MLAFKSQQAEKAGTAVSTVAPPTAWLGPSIQVKGDIMGTDDLLIHGSLEGMIQLDERRLTVGTAAKLTADISAQDVVVYGFVRGDVRATRQIEIKKDGSVIGNLTATQIMIEDGANFRGSVAIDRNSANESSLHGTSTGAA
jgi:cytoskeletal protein CcmA (bactofilin family)